MRFGFALTLLVLLAPVAYASAPGTNEGPAGCDWRATVLDVNPDDKAVIDLKLSQLIGTCMYQPGACGKADDLVSVHVKKDDIRHYRVGQIVKVWVTGATISFDHPQCVSSPGQGSP